MRTGTAVLGGLLTLCLILVGVTAWWMHAHPATTKDRLEQLKEKVGSWTQPAEGADDEIFAPVAEETVAEEESAVAEEPQVAEEEAEADDSPVVEESGDAPLAALRKATCREIARQRQAAYKELRPLDQQVFRLKNKSIGIRPHEPPKSASSKTWEEYRRALSAYEAANGTILADLKQATAARDKAAETYTKVKKDAATASRCSPGELQALAGRYGVSVRE